MWIELIDLDDSVVINSNSIVSVMVFEEKVFDTEGEEEFIEANRVYDEDLGPGSGIVIRTNSGGMFRIYSLSYNEFVKILQEQNNKFRSFTTDRWYYIEKDETDAIAARKLEEIRIMIKGIGYHVTGGLGFTTQFSFVG